MPISNRDELLASLREGQAGFPAISGTPEDAWIDFKQSHYRLAEKRQRIELAKDVSGFANAGGGVVVVGIETQRLPNQHIEVASKLTPVRMELLNLSQIRDVLRQYVYPRVNGLECSIFEISDDKGVLVIEVPKQDSEDQPFVVTEGISEEGEHYGNMFGWFQREGDSTQPALPSFIHDLLRDGFRLRRMLSHSTSQFAALAPESAAPDTVSEKERRAQAEGDAADLQVEDAPHLVVQAWKPSGFRLPDIHGEFKRNFLSPPQLRVNGFNVGFSHGLEVLEGGGLRKARPRTASLSVLPNGLSTLVVGSHYLGWAMGDSNSWGQELINPVPLVELIYEFCSFFSTHVRDESNGPEMNVQARLCRLDVEGARRLAPGDLHRLYGFDDSKLPGGEASEIVTDIVNQEAPERAAFELLADIYRQYGLPEDAIPFTDKETRVVSPTKLGEQRSG